MHLYLPLVSIIILTSKLSCISHCVSSGWSFTDTVPRRVSDRRKPLKQGNQLLAKQLAHPHLGYYINMKRQIKQQKQKYCQILHKQLQLCALQSKHCDLKMMWGVSKEYFSYIITTALTDNVQMHIKIHTYIWMYGILMLRVLKEKAYIVLNPIFFFFFLQYICRWRTYK